MSQGGLVLMLGWHRHGFRSNSGARAPEVVLSVPGEVAAMSVGETAEAGGGIDGGSKKVCPG